MNEMELKERTKAFAKRVLKVVDALADTPKCRVIAYQLTKAGTSVAANYRAACRARSLAEFIAKLGIVEEEADESAFWLEIIVDDEILPVKLLEGLLQEANEITAIMSASRITAKRSANRQSPIKNRKSGASHGLA